MGNGRPAVYAELAGILRDIRVPQLRLQVPGADENDHQDRDDLRHHDGIVHPRGGLQAPQQQQGAQRRNEHGGQIDEGRRTVNVPAILRIEGRRQPCGRQVDAHLMQRGLRIAGPADRHQRG